MSRCCSSWGSPPTPTAWMFQLPDFAERYRTIVFDNRGVGRSAKPAGPYTIHQMADDAAGLLDALSIPRAHVVGVSMGGMIAQELVLRHPERVRGLVLGVHLSRARRRGRAATASSRSSSSAARSTPTAAMKIDISRRSTR